MACYEFPEGYLECDLDESPHDDRLTEEGRALARAMLKQVRPARVAAWEVVACTLARPHWAPPVKALLARAELILEGMLIDNGAGPYDEGFCEVVGAVREALFAYWGSKAIAKEVAHA